MKRIAFLFTSITMMLALQKVMAQAPDWTRLLQVNTYGTQNLDAVATDNSSNVYSIASISGPVTFNGVNYTSIGGRDLLVVKANSAGEINWIKQFDAQVNGVINGDAINVDASGNIYVAARFSGTITIGSNTLTSDSPFSAFVAKFNSNGEGIWASTFIFSGAGSSKMAIDASGNVFLLSFSTKLIKFNASGEKLWEQQYKSKTLQAIAINGSDLFIGGTLQSGTTTFGSISLTSSGSCNNTGFILRADLDGVYNNSTLVTGPTFNIGTSVSDIVVDNSGNLFITGGYLKKLVIGSITIAPDLTNSRYTYIAKCDRDFTFAWAKSSSKIIDTYSEISTYRIFLDGSNNIYEFGMNSCTFGFGTVQVNSTNKQFLFKFNSSGDELSGFTPEGTSFGKTVVASNGNIVVAGNYSYSGAASYGNFFINSCDNNLALQWSKVSSNNFSGTAKIYSVKHDADRNTYIYAGITGYCNYFGTIINSNTYLSVISKHDINGNLLWIKQISDIEPTLIYGVQFTLDKDYNVLVVGSYKTTLTIGNATLNTTNTGDILGYVAKFNSSGVFQWASNVNCVTSINLASDKNGSVLVTGVVAPNNYLVKFDASGNQLWEKSMPMESNYNSIVSTDNSNNIYLGSEIHLEWSTPNSTTIGTITLTQTPEDGSSVLIKFDPDGNAIWAKTYGGVTGASYADGWPCSMVNDSEGNSYIWGICKNNANFGTSTLTNPYGFNYLYYIAKVNASGDVLWVKPIYENIFGFNYGDLVGVDKNDNVYIGGHYNDKVNIEGVEYSPVGTNDYFMIKYSKTGTYEWMKTIPSNLLMINALCVYDDNIVSIAGYAGKDQSLGNFAINKKGGSSCMVATLGNLLYMNLSTNSKTIPSTVSSNSSFDISSNVDWTATSDQTWLTLNSTSGSGNTTITLTATANPTTSTRTAIVTVSGTNVESKIVTVTQEAASPSLSVSVSTLTLSSSASSNSSFDIASNISWTASSDQTWLTLNSTSGSGNTTITITATANPTTATRTATITVSGANVESKTVTVTQEGIAPILTVSANTLTLPSTASSNSSFDITSNISWTASSDQAWLTLNSTSGSGNTTITLTASANPTTATRTVTITVAGSNVTSKTISVTQEGNTTGVETLDRKPNFTIYPNPNNGRFNVTLNSYNSEQVFVTVSNLQGVVVKEFTIKNVLNSYSQEIELGDVAKGLYLITIKRNNSKEVKSIIVQ